MAVPSDKSDPAALAPHLQGPCSIEKLDQSLSDEDLTSLRQIGGKVKAQVWLVAWFSGAERFAYYALQVPLQNYIQNPASDDFERPGALGMGQSWASALNYSFMLISYTIPLFAGVLADGRWGPYKVLVVSCCVYLCGILLLLLTSLPPLRNAGAGVGGLIGSFVLIGLAVGGIKSTVAPFTADQIRPHDERIEVLKTGERIVVNHKLTVRKAYSIFYWTTNVGALSGLASTSLEKYIGFWASFLLSFISLSIGLVILLVGKKSFYCREPQPSFRAKLLRALGCAIKGGFCLDAAEPANQLEKYGRVVEWDRQFVDDLRQAVKACKILSFYPIVWLCYSQNNTSLISQAGQMITYGIPNDALQALNPLFVLISVPVLEQLVYPNMHKIGCPDRATVRITLGFILFAVSMASAAAVQQTIYNAPPCFNMALECPDSHGGQHPNEISVFLQVPTFVIGAFGEVLFSVSGSEYAYNKAAPHMKSTLQAFTQLTVAIGSALGIAVSPVTHNPHLVIVFSSFAAAVILNAAVFGGLFWGHE